MVSYGWSSRDDDRRCGPTSSTHRIAELLPTFCSPLLNWFKLQSYFTLIQLNHSSPSPTARSTL